MVRSITFTFTTSSSARRWLAASWGSPEGWELGDYQPPAPGAGEITVQVRAAGVNPADAKHVAAPRDGVDLPVAIGYEISGVVTAVGPDTSDGADFFGMFWSFAPDLSLIGSPLIGYGYTNGGTTSYAYLVASGDYSVAPVNSVPEPATALLVLPALLLLRRRLRRNNE